MILILIDIYCQSCTYAPEKEYKVLFDIVCDRNKTLFFKLNLIIF